MQKNHHLVIGLGLTGLSCVRYLISKNRLVSVVDTRENPPKLADCQKEFPNVKIHLGKFQESIFSQADTLIVSPGMSLAEPCIVQCIEKNIPVMGDVELFARDAKAPIVAITGSNGKSTLTTLMGDIINNVGKKAIICGNIGLPVLEAMMQPTPDYYVVELSSFQLDTTYSLKAKVAVVINVSPDHMDRYATFNDYLASKQRVYMNCENAVVNFDEKNSWQDINFKNTVLQFTLNKPDKNQFGLYQNYLCHGDKKLIAVSDLILQERHNNQNYLAALAMCFILKLPIESVLNTLKKFSGLAHRCQLVKSENNIAWYNDSKATNVGASIAAIESIAQRATGRLILIAGGDSKGVDLDLLKLPVKQHVSHVILLGRDAPLLEAALLGCAEITCVRNMDEAVNTAKKMVQPGDIVLLAPACSSLDQYENYMARGDDFIKAVIGDQLSLIPDHKEHHD
ncbi:MAG: UDP-N-acetylmuramoylalanine--D-glutamate ligase [Gammaproteobacteria bacterium RIFCSPHIGHO2_12_FULL_38_11]|nr:MAG: UDP-N-acetylmuramoylalanine--D-glutamate ligase [Gammaproteobacteria bacterium RIFCSPHIGHO2_12_FULL_38_11]